MAISLTKKDYNKVAQLFASLHCILRRNVIWGTLEFSCSYDSESNELVYGEKFDNYLHDSYEIRIDFNKHDTFGFPKIFEESGIIKDFADSNNIKIEDLHINKADDHSCCLGVFPEYQWIDAATFIHDKVVPFFYWQSYRRLYGKEPWKALPHGVNGIIESMTVKSDDSSKGKIRNKTCPCGSGKKYKKCCMRKDEILKHNYKDKIRLMFDDALKIKQLNSYSQNEPN